MEVATDQRLSLSPPARYGWRKRLKSKNVKFSAASSSSPAKGKSAAWGRVSGKRLKPGSSPGAQAPEQSNAPLSVVVLDVDRTLVRSTRTFSQKNPHEHFAISSEGYFHFALHSASCRDLLRDPFDTDSDEESADGDFDSDSEEEMSISAAAALRETRHKKRHSHSVQRLNQFAKRMKKESRQHYHVYIRPGVRKLFAYLRRLQKKKQMKVVVASMGARDYVVRVVRGLRKHCGKNRTPIFDLKVTREDWDTTDCAFQHPAGVDIYRGPLPRLDEGSAPAALEGVEESKTDTNDGDEDRPQPRPPGGAGRGGRGEAGGAAGQAGQPGGGGAHKRPYKSLERILDLLHARLKDRFTAGMQHPVLLSMSPEDSETENHLAPLPSPRMNSKSGSRSGSDPQHEKKPTLSYSFPSIHLESAGSLQRSYSRHNIPLQIACDLDLDIQGSPWLSDEETREVEGSMSVQSYEHDVEPEGTDIPTYDKAQVLVIDDDLGYYAPRDRVSGSIFSIRAWDGPLSHLSRKYDPHDMDTELDTIEQLIRSIVGHYQDIQQFLFKCVEGVIEAQYQRDRQAKKDRQSWLKALLIDVGVDMDADAAVTCFWLLDSYLALNPGHQGEKSEYVEALFGCYVIRNFFKYRVYPSSHFVYVPAARVLSAASSDDDATGPRTHCGSNGVEFWKGIVEMYLPTYERLLTVMKIPFPDDPQPDALQTKMISMIQWIMSQLFTIHNVCFLGSGVLGVDRNTPKELTKYVRRLKKIHGVVMRKKS